MTWGQGAVNNSIGWGKAYDNVISWGAVYASSNTGDTNITGA
jgi:hypothetical protein